MQGKIKWFSKEKGYGFITGTDEIDRHFGINDIKGSDLPSIGDIVNFIPKDGQKGPKAYSIIIESKAPIDTSIKNFSSAKEYKQPKTDDRVECSYCGKRMIPRMITYRGEPSKSVCPFCGSTFMNFGYCFIATAVYEDYNAPEVIKLRKFRDEKLKGHFFGDIFVFCYYKISPPFANYLSRTPIASRKIKKLLDFIAGKIH
jgi:cold shock CspA family protein/predicted RNA-binding Zn-ribbon protein involved in translation (DUF1610 family)